MDQSQKFFERTPQESQMLGLFRSGFTASGTDVAAPGTIEYASNLPLVRIAIFSFQRQDS